MKGTVTAVDFFGAAYLYRPKRACGCCVLEGGSEELLRGTAQELEKSGRDSLPALVALPVANWDGELTPWHSDCIPGRSFTGGGAERAALLKGCLPEFLAGNGLPAPREELAIAGHSLGGLAALYAYFETGLFSRAASVSGAVWYPGFTDYAAARRIPYGDRVYLSLGKQEARRGNPLMTRGGEAAERIARHAGQFCRSAFVWNNGNHFYEPERRMVRAIFWLFGEDEPCGT